MREIKKNMTEARMCRYEGKAGINKALSEYES